MDGDLRGLKFGVWWDLDRMGVFLGFCEFMRGIWL